ISASGPVQSGGAAGANAPSLWTVGVRASYRIFLSSAETPEEDRLYFSTRSLQEKSVQQRAKIRMRRSIRAIVELSMKKRGHRMPALRRQEATFCFIFRR